MNDMPWVSATDHRDAAVVLAIYAAESSIKEPVSRVRAPRSREHRDAGGQHIAAGLGRPRPSSSTLLPPSHPTFAALPARRGSPPTALDVRQPGPQ